jgi:hypothetical protein
VHSRYGDGAWVRPCVCVSVAMSARARARCACVYVQAARRGMVWEGGESGGTRVCVRAGGWSGEGGAESGWAVWWGGDDFDGQGGGWACVPGEGGGGTCHWT